MKKFLSSLCLCALSALCVPAAFSAQKSVPATPEHLGGAAIDFFNFELMQKGFAGKNLREQIFESLMQTKETRTIITRMNDTFGTRLPESLRSVSIIHFPATAKMPAFNVAQIKTNDDFSAFFSVLKKQKYAEFSLDGLRFVELSPTLENCVPAIFKLENSGVFAARSPAGDILLISFPRDETAKLAAAGFSAKFPEGNAFLGIPDVMVFRIFPCREIPQTEPDQNCPLIPAGEFLLAESGDRIKLAVRFFCKNPEERKTLRAVFGRLKKLIHSEIAELKNFANALTETEDENALCFDLDGNSRDFAMFLQWQKSRAGSRN